MGLTGALRWRLTGIKILNSFYVDYGRKVADKLSGKTPAVIQHQAAKLGLIYRNSSSESYLFFHGVKMNLIY